MAVPAGPTEVRYVGNGVTTVFAIPFLLILPTDLDVFLNGVEQTSGYLITGAGNPESTITFTTAPAVGADVYLALNVPFERLNDYQENGDFLATTVNRDFDRIWQGLKQLYRGATRALTLGSTDVDGSGWYRAKGNGIRDLADPVAEQDATNFRSVRTMIEQAIAGVVGGFGWFMQFGAGAIVRTFQDKMRERLPTLEDFGGKGDYATDNLDALSKLLASGGKGMNLNRGMYRFSDNIDLPTGFVIRGVGAPTLGFGTIDDKQFLRNGYKQNMTGSSLIFSGTGTKTYPLPQRIDEFSTVRPCIRLSQAGVGSLGTKWSGFAIIQDMICFKDDGVTPTKPWEDQRAGYDVAVLIDDVARTDMVDVVRFGYFGKAGTAISSVLGNDDPDYNTFWGGSTVGKHGIALLGSNNGPATHGLSGTRCFGMGIYTLDHHSRATMTTDELIDYYSTANTWDCIYIDGDIDASSAEINGHEFHACEIRQRSNHGIRLDHASNVKFYGGVYEFTPYGITNSDTPTFIGSANVKRGIIFDGLRNNFLGTIFNPNFVGLIPVPVMVSGDPLNGRMGVFGRNPAGGYAGSLLGSDGNIGDASIQITDDANSGSSGWRMNIDISDPTQPLQWKKEAVIKASLSDLGSYSVAAPAGSDAALIMTSNGGSNVWAQRAQVSSAGQWQFRFGGSGSTPVLQILTNGTITPGTTGVPDVGSASLRYNNAFLVNSPNVSSDENLKEQISDIPEAWLVAARNIKPVRYKMRASVLEKGEAARWHIGVSAQQVVQAFADQNVDAFKIGLVGRDSWDDHYDDVMAPVLDDDGTPTGDYQPTGEQVLTRAAGEELSVRYEELLALMEAARL